jgi:hypothetical protein
MQACSHKPTAQAVGYLTIASLQDDVGGLLRWGGGEASKGEGKCPSYRLMPHGGRKYGNVGE